MPQSLKNKCKYFGAGKEYESAYETGCSTTLTLKGSNSPLKEDAASTSFTLVTLYLKRNKNLVSGYKRIFLHLLSCAVGSLILRQERVHFRRVCIFRVLKRNF